MVILDRFEGEHAVLETDGEISTINRSLIADDAREGDMLIFLNGKYSIDRKSTEKRREEIRAKMQRLFGNED